MAAGPQSVNLAIRHVTQRRERMPQTRVTMSEDPPESVESESTTNLSVFVNVAVVIEVDEVVTECLSKNDPDDGGEKNTDRDGDQAIVSRAGLRRNCRHR